MEVDAEGAAWPPRGLVKKEGGAAEAADSAAVRVHHTLDKRRGDQRVGRVAPGGEDTSALVGRLRLGGGHEAPTWLYFFSIHVG